MRRLFMIVMLAAAVPAFAQEQKTPTLKSVLLQQLRDTHSKSNWFVCADVAVAGLTSEQASWTDGKGNHSVGQLANHLIFWNQLNLESMKGQKPEKFSGNNDETFNSFDAKSWNATVKKLDEVLTELERLVESADDAKLKAVATTIANINAHNAYHIGEMVVVRKEQGSWDPSKGVK